MKLCKLKLKNLNSFRSAIEINFEESPLDAAALVAITGPTGAGKTTLLDAICVALYGKTPRLSGTKNQHPKYLISQGETEGFAEVHFEVDRTRYRAIWSLAGGKSPKGQLFTDTGEPITTKVAEKIDKILGLDFGAFKRSVMLAQGEFAAFLKAGREERRNILEATAGIAIYDQLKETLNKRVSVLEAANDEVLSKLEGISPEVSPEQLRVEEAEQGKLEQGVATLQARNEQLDQEKAGEAQRKADFEALQVSERRENRLIHQQTLISEWRRADQTEILENEAFYSAMAALDRTAAERTKAEERDDQRGKQLSQVLEQIQDIQTFLNENSLPLDRQQRLRDAREFLVRRNEQEGQLKRETENRAEQEQKVARLEGRVRDLSEALEARLAEVDQAASAVEDAAADLEVREAGGTLRDWNVRREEAVILQSLAQSYEMESDGLTESEIQLDELDDQKIERGRQLRRLARDLAHREAVYKGAARHVENCEAELRSAFLSDSANQLRTHLHEGEPCPVCGATEHPAVGGVDVETQGRLEAAEHALAEAKAVAQSEQTRLQELQTRQAQIEQDLNNTEVQIEAHNVRMKALQNEMASRLAEWQETYPDADVSTAWLTERVAEAEAARTAISEAKEAHTGASYALEIATQKLEACESNVENEKRALVEAQEQLGRIKASAEDLRVDIAAIEESFWELLPDTFHGVAPDAAIALFEEKIEKVAEYQGELDRAEAALRLLETGIEADRSNLLDEIARLRERFTDNPFDPAAWEAIAAESDEAKANLGTEQERLGEQRARVAQLRDDLEKREALSDQQREAQRELDRWKTLQETIPSNKLRDFALEIMFRQMGSFANTQLRYLTSERYQLKVESIGDLSVVDRWNANEERPVETLSGGESFLTSLALALALSDLSRGHAQLNSLFLDEGFGTLDADTLDIAIAALEGLRLQGRSIFLISHVQELTRRLPVKINVKKRGDGRSSIEIPR